MHGARGASLVEALVALLVLAFGMLAILGIQATMRLNSDMAKQRSEAVRIAQESLERWRGYSVLDSTEGRTAYADIDTPDDMAAAGYTTNTDYTLSRTVTEMAAQGHKIVRVGVAWVDRSGIGQQVALNSIIAGVDPALTAALVTGAAGNPSQRPRNRHAAIPLDAKDIGNGLSAFKPPVPGATGDAGGIVAWVFDNRSGLITGVCAVAAAVETQGLTSTDIAGCSANTVAQLISGYVRFSTDPAQPTAADAERPRSPARNLDLRLTLTSSGHPSEPSCFDNAPATVAAAAATTAVRYYCAIPANGTRSWSGHTTIVPLPFTDQAESGWDVPTRSTPSTSHRLCRYTPAVSDSVVVPNAQHPRLYRIEYRDPASQQLPLPTPPLPNQNFLVIDGGFACPSDLPSDPATGDFVNSNTLPHLPWP